MYAQKLHIDRWDGDVIPTPSTREIKTVSLQEINHNQRRELVIDKARREQDSGPIVSNRLATISSRNQTPGLPKLDQAAQPSKNAATTSNLKPISPVQPSFHEESQQSLQHAIYVVDPQAQQKPAIQLHPQPDITEQFKPEFYHHSPTSPSQEDELFEPTFWGYPSSAH